jgi:proline dehydrogenase
MNQKLPYNISFDNTEYAFAYKSNKDLKKAHFLFSSMGKPLLVKLGLSIMPLAIKWKIPFIKSIIRKTIFSQFVGGETLDKTKSVVDKLEQYGVNVILDYGVEGGEGELAFDLSTKEFLNVIDYASQQKNIPFISIKITGLSRFGLLEKIDSLMTDHSDTSLFERYQKAIEYLSFEEQNEWKRVVDRLMLIGKTAFEKEVSVLVDAEESWIQEPVDAITLMMMQSYNQKRAIIYNTYQLYRHDRLSFLKVNFQLSQKNNFILGAKIVRGAYMEKERKRAIDMGYESPIQISKENTDKDYNEALEFCLSNNNQIALIIASHNEYSNLLASQIMVQKNINANRPHVHFSQLYGMSDNITFNLAHSGCSVSKYLPFGPIKDVIPYLMRRAQENSSVAGQTGRELGLIKKELKRRKQM